MHLTAYERDNLLGETKFFEAHLVEDTSGNALSGISGLSHLICMDGTGDVIRNENLDVRARVLKQESMYDADSGQSFWVYVIDRALYSDGAASSTP